MTDYVIHLISTYGYLAVFLATAYDHTGTPAAMMLSIGVGLTGLLHIPTIFAISFAGGIAGDLFLYAIGRYGGPKTIRWITNNKPYRQEAVGKIGSWFHTYGGSIIIWGRFVAFVGKFTSLVMGSLQYQFSRFIFFTTIGNAVTLILFGLPTYWLGKYFNLAFDNNTVSLYFTAGIIVLQVVITLFMWWKHKQKQNRYSQV